MGFKPMEFWRETGFTMGLRVRGVLSGEMHGENSLRELGCPGHRDRALSRVRLCRAAALIASCWAGREEKFRNRAHGEEGEITSPFLCELRRLCGTLTFGLEEPKKVKLEIAPTLVLLR
jgi:hypothetical protein